MRRLALVIAASVAGLWGCGGGSTDKTLTIYSSLPSHGTSKDRSAAIADGIDLALEQARGRAGDFRIEHKSLEDSTAQAEGWDPGATAEAARTVALDPHAIGYIGDLDSDASRISIPILNQADIMQVSPANTYVGLTTGGAGSEKGEPQKYYPTGERTYARLVPSDEVQARVLLARMRSDGCEAVLAVHDGGTEGAGLVRALEAEAGDGMPTIVPLADTGRELPSAARLQRRGVDCVLFAATASPRAVALAGALRDARVYGSHGVCEPRFTRGLPPEVAGRFTCTAPTPDLEATAEGRRFARAYRERYGAPPDPAAAYGYEAAQLLLDTIARLGETGDHRETVTDAVLATKDRRSVLGTYSLDEHGDTTLTAYGIYDVTGDGDLLLVDEIR